jgi:hypothetical protein
MPEPATPPRKPDAEPPRLRTVGVETPHPAGGGGGPAPPRHGAGPAPSAFGPTGLGTATARIVPKPAGVRPPEAPEPDRRVKP